MAMSGHAAWRVRTRFRELTLTLGAAAEPEPGSAPLLSDLLFEIDSGNQAIARVLEGILETLGPPRLSPRAAPGLGWGAELDDLKRELEVAVSRGELALREVPKPHVPSLEPVADAGEDQDAAPEPEPELTFIGVELRDADDRLVTDRRVRIELPDGQVHERFVGLDGRVRVDGLTTGGSAKITVLPIAGNTDGQAAVGSEEPEPEVQPLEVTFVDLEGNPLEGLALLADFDGQIAEGKSAADGSVSFDVDEGTTAVTVSLKPEAAPS
jgi:hypothetical protein